MADTKSTYQAKRGSGAPCDKADSVGLGELDTTNTGATGNVLKRTGTGLEWGAESGGGILRAMYFVRHTSGGNVTGPSDNVWGRALPSSVNGVRFKIDSTSDVVELFNQGVINMDSGTNANTSASPFAIEGRFMFRKATTLAGLSSATFVASNHTSINITNLENMNDGIHFRMKLASFADQDDVAFPMMLIASGLEAAYYEVVPYYRNTLASYDINVFYGAQLTSKIYDATPTLT